MSDVHVGSGLFRPELLSAVVQEANDLEPDLVAIVGDLTMEGYRWEFEEARATWTALRARTWSWGWATTTPGTSATATSRSFSGCARRRAPVPVPEGEAKVVSLDSTKPDLDEGELGREHYGWLDSEFRGWDRGPRIVMIHHHILAVPGTGRDVNILLDSGDVMAILRELKVDMVLSVIATSRTCGASRG
jgi:3',5'-cyclic AMP phosphodiesterase CpdA